MCQMMANSRLPMDVRLQLYSYSRVHATIRPLQWTTTCTKSDSVCFIIYMRCMKPYLSIPYHASFWKTWKVCSEWLYLFSTIQGCNGWDTSRGIVQEYCKGACVVSGPVHGLWTRGCAFRAPVSGLAATYPRRWNYSAIVYKGSAVFYSGLSRSRFLGIIQVPVM